MSEEPLSKLRRLQQQVTALFDESPIGPHEESALPRAQRFARFWIMVVQSFLRNRCAVRATALAYTTLLAIVPVLAVVLSISTGLLKSERGQDELKAYIPEMIEKVAPQLGLVSKADGTDAQSRVVETIIDSIQSVNSKVVGVSAMVAILFIGISLLATIETALNDIWGVSRGRSWFARAQNYATILVFGPLVLLASGGLIAGGHVSTLQALLDQVPFIKFLYSLMPLVIVSLALGVFFKLMPNTKVEWTAAFVGGAVAGLLWALNNQLNILYFGQVVRNSQIYGGLAALPVFLIGLYFSWIILLFGAQVAYAYQNRRAYLQERFAESVNEDSLELVALRLMTDIARRFDQGEGPTSLKQLSEALSMPGKLATRALTPLLRAKLLVEVQGSQTAYTPGRPLEDISYMDILEAVRTQCGRSLEVSDPAVLAELERIRAAERETAAAVTLASVIQPRT